MEENNVEGWPIVLVVWIDWQSQCILCEADWIHFSLEQKVEFKRGNCKSNFAIVYKSNDKYFSSKGIHDHIDVSVKASSVIQKYKKLWELHECLDKDAKKMKKLHRKVQRLIELGLSMSFDTTQQYIGDIPFKYKMEEKMKLDLDLFPTDTNVANFFSMTKPLITLNVALDETLMSTSTSNYELLTNLQVTSYMLEQFGVLSNGEWSILYKLKQWFHNMYCIICIAK